MSLKRRLARLAPPHPPSSDPSGASSRVGDSDSPARDEVLGQLRQRMQAILGREQVTEQPPKLRSESGLQDLLLLEQTNRLGVYWLGSKRLPLSEHVGRLCVSGADQADPERLALLALDADLGSVDPARALYLDTETTGLGGAGTFAFVVGLGFFCDGRLHVEQLVLSGPEQEPASLLHLSERIEACEMLVSFNGKAFDWPLLEGRYVMNRMPRPPKRPHLDLLHLARRVHKQRLKCCKLTSLESQVLGFERVGDIDGAEVCSRYLHYLRSGDASGIQAVLEHNHWDVISMAALVALYGEARPALDAQDFVGIAHTLRRARRFEQARHAADVAVSAGVGAKALQVRAEIGKVLGDRVAALRDFEAANRLQSSPELRLELAKLYEHFAKRPERALELLAQGTKETEAALSKRRQRLERKVRRKLTGS